MSVPQEQLRSHREPPLKLTGPGRQGQLCELMLEHGCLGTKQNPIAIASGRISFTFCMPEFVKRDLCLQQKYNILVCLFTICLLIKYCFFLYFISLFQDFIGGQNGKGIYGENRCNSEIEAINNFLLKNIFLVSVFSCKIIFHWYWWFGGIANYSDLMPSFHSLFSLFH